MAHYVDGFVLPVPKKNINAYRRMAQKAGKVWREHGALEFRECVGDDLDVKMGLPFLRGIKIKSGETVVFSWIVYKSREREGHEGPAHCTDAKDHAVRCKAHDVRRIQDDRRSVSSLISIQLGFNLCFRHGLVSSVGRLGAAGQVDLPKAADWILNKRF
jgi:uncharacterized protein YbaA (DUF1428 family)